MAKRSRYSPEVRERAVRMVLEPQGEHHTQWGTIGSIAEKMDGRQLRRRFGSGSGRPSGTKGCAPG